MWLIQEEQINQKACYKINVKYPKQNKLLINSQDIFEMWGNTNCLKHYLLLTSGYHLSAILPALFYHELQVQTHIMVKTRRNNALIYNNFKVCYWKKYVPITPCNSINRGLNEVICKPKTPFKICVSPDIIHYLYLIIDANKYFSRRV